MTDASSKLERYGVKMIIFFGAGSRYDFAIEIPFNGFEMNI
jgi:hypothetical protein